MARNMSLFKLRIAAIRKKGRDTRVAVEASGSAYLRLKYSAILTINKEVNRDAKRLLITGKIEAPLVSSLLILGNVVNRETAEKHNR